MALLLSSWSKNAKSVPQDYILPPDRRPQQEVPICKEIPVIDLALAMGSKVERAKQVEQMIKALDESIGFQVINHGLPEKVMEDAMEIYKEFFNLPVEEKEKYVSDGTHENRSAWLYSGGYRTGYCNQWRDALGHICHPIEKTIDYWPDKPARYREVIAEYAIETKKISQKILELIAEGLGLEKGYFAGELAEIHVIHVNYYPKCPDPSLTVGAPEHYDLTLCTMIQQNLSGIRIFKNEKWLAVQPFPDAFFILPGFQLEIVSNGRFKTTLHQVVANAEADRLSIGLFINSTHEAIVEPAKAVLNDGNPPKFRPYNYVEFMKNYERRIVNGEPHAAAGESAFSSFYIKV